MFLTKMELCETAPPESILARAQLYKGWLTRSKGKIDIQ